MSDKDYWICSRCNRRVSIELGYCPRCNCSTKIKGDDTAERELEVEGSFDIED